MTYNADELEGPAWMNENFFEKVLRSSENDDSIKVTEILVKPGSNVGDHFASVMFKVTIDYRTKTSDSETQKVVVKTTPFVEGIKMDMMKDSPLFEVETKMYGKTLQDMQKVLNAAGETFTLAPRFLYETQNPQPVIVLEDISPKGFVTLDQPTNLDQSLLVYSRLAKFHAASLYLSETDETIRQYDKSLFLADNDFIDRLFKDNIHLFVKELKTWGPDYQIYYEKLDKIKDKIVRLGDHLFVTNEPGKGYNVLNHGDFHTKNMLVKWDENNEKVNDIILLDFQICYWASPALDIIYGFYTMIDTSIRENYRDELIFHYYNEFSATLKKLGFKGRVPTLLELNLEIMKKGEFEVVLAAAFLQYQFIDLKSGDFDMEEFFKEDATEKKSQYLRNPLYVAAMRKVLPQFLHKGFLN